MKKEYYDGEWICWFCKKDLPSKKVDKHHIYGKRNSDMWKPCHRKCHREYHKQKDNK